jgi:hypothetical protein
MHAGCVFMKWKSGRENFLRIPRNGVAKYFLKLPCVQRALCQRKQHVSRSEPCGKDGGRHEQAEGKTIKQTIIFAVEHESNFSEINLYLYAGWFTGDLRSE